MAATSSDTPDPAPEEALLTPSEAAAYLRSRGLIAPAEEVEATALGGGVSNIVLAVQASNRQLIVKQSLPRLRVADEWLAPQQRVLSEAAALELAGGLDPGSVPRVIDRDPDRYAIVLEHAPARWRDWKGLLLAGVIDPGVAARLGELAGHWHRATSGGRGLPDCLAGDEALEAFEALRLDPYHRTTAARAPELAGRLVALADQLRQRRSCLVHGDLSPKNVLVGPGGLWVIDFEVAHYGDPVFDVAFLVNHLVLKSLHRPADRAGYDACATAFLAAYQGELDWPYAFSQLGCLLLARVRGKSPAEYLTDDQRDAAWRLGSSLLADPPCDLDAVIRRREEVLP